MQKSKIGFSSTELKLVNDREIILTKTNAIETVYNLFGNLGSLLFEDLKPLQTLYPQVFSVLPKISKGENYLGFPWVMLDYPRYFHQKDGHFAIRVFFWWGHCFMVQMHFSGQFARLIEKLKRNEKFGDFANSYETYLGHPEDPWDNALPQTTMYRVQVYDQNNSNFRNSYVKLMVPIPFEKSEKLAAIVLELSSITRDILMD